MNTKPGARFSPRAERNSSQLFIAANVELSFMPDSFHISKRADPRNQCEPTRMVHALCGGPGSHMARALYLLRVIFAPGGDGQSYAATATGKFQDYSRISN